MVIYRLDQLIVEESAMHESRTPFERAGGMVVVSERGLAERVPAVCPTSRDRNAARHRNRRARDARLDRRRPDRIRP